MRDKYGQILNALKGANMRVFSLAMAAFIIAVSLASLRLKLIIDVQDDISATFPEAFSLTFIGYFFNNFLPTSIGGDVVKAYYLSKKTTGKASSFTSVFVDRAIGLVTMVFMAFVALIFARGIIVDDAVRYMIYAIMAISLFGILFILNKNLAKKLFGPMFFLKPVEEKLKNIYNAAHMYKHHKILLVQSLVISVLSQIFFFISIGVLALSIGSRISVTDILLRMPVVSILSMLPSINGLGLREGATVLFFGPLIGSENAFAVSILWLLVLFIASIMGGLIYALSPQFKFKLKEIE